MTVEAYQPKCNYINTAFISANVSVDLTNAKVLEIYGNAGQLLADPENVVKQENYTVFETYKSIDLNDFFVVQNPLKPIRPMSQYKLSDLHVICDKLGISYDSLKKNEIYSAIVKNIME